MTDMELKAYIAPTADGTGLADYYLKSEADKVIADLEESHKKEVEQLLMEIMKLKHSLELASNECCSISERGVKNARHQKYKRCLAMAMWCESENYTSCWYHENSERCEWTEKWQNRWLELAEKFKPNNSTAQ